MFAGVGDRKERWGADILATEANSRAMNQRTDEIISKTLEKDG